MLCFFTPCPSSSWACPQCYVLDVSSSSAHTHLLVKEAKGQSSGLYPGLWSWWGRVEFETRVDTLPTAGPSLVLTATLQPLCHLKMAG